MIAIGKWNTTQLTVVGKNSAINILFTKKSKVIQEACDGDKEVNNIGIINANSIGFMKIKLAESKNIL